MSAYEVKIEGREEVAEGTMAFRLSKPTGFSFKPGQAMDVVLIESPAGDEQNARHAFSIVSAPFEDHLTIATRMRDSAFKRALKSLAIGSPVRLEGPFGSLILHNKRARPAVFIAGGIGVTPFMSILRQAAQDQVPQRLVLLYSNRRPRDAAFLAELQALEQRHPYFRMVATMTQMGQDDQPWTGERGVIGQELVKQAASGLDAPIYYLAGPPAMVESIRKTLNLAGIDDDDIRAEEFYGY